MLRPLRGAIVSLHASKQISSLLAFLQAKVHDSDLSSQNVLPRSVLVELTEQQWDNFTCRKNILALHSSGHSYLRNVHTIVGDISDERSQIFFHLHFNVCLKICLLVPFQQLIQTAKAYSLYLSVRGVTIVSFHQQSSNSREPNFNDKTSLQMPTIKLERSI